MMSTPAGQKMRATAIRETEGQGVPQLQQALARFIGAVIARPDAAMAMLDLPILQLRCLRLIAENEGQKLRDLAERIELPLPSVSRLVDRLVRAGLVARQTDPGDRRAVKLETTEQSREILARQRAVREAHLASLARHLTPAQIGMVVEGLSLLTEAAEQAHAEQDDLDR